MTLLQLLWILLLPTTGSAFGSFHNPFFLTSPTSSTRLHISNFINNKNINNPSSSNNDQLPRDVKEAVSKCRKAVQSGLEQRLSRMYVEFPVGTKFGVEKATGKTKKGSKLASALKEDLGSGLTVDLLETSDRELARLFVEMFQPVGGENISVVFSDENLADKARSFWKDDPTAICRVSSLDRGKSKKPIMKGMGRGLEKKKAKKRQGFAEKLNEEFSDETSGPFKLPSGCEVALFVAPTAKDLIAIKRVCDEVGMGTLVVLLNARFELIDNFGSEEAKQLFLEEFERVFFLSIAPQDVAPGCLLHRAFPNDWIIARKPKVGQPKTIGTFQSLPSDEECRIAYESVEIGELEKGVENVIDNLSSWLK